MAELTKLGRYELRRALGKGAMGVVYEGFDPSLGRRVAIKTILKSAVIDEETERAYLARFAREARAAGRLNHPHIVQVYDFGEQAEVAYLVMEFIEGRELAEFSNAGQRFELPESVRIMSELLDALQVAHEAGIIHRDVKPANVMLDAQRRVKLADFGVARIQDGKDRTKTGTLVGTPAFMSPEQVTGGRVDRRSDLFSAGIVLYQLLTGEQPFKGEGAWTVAKKIIQDEPPRPSTLVSSLSPVFDQVINRALAKRPEERFASASEFAAALKSALEGQDLAESGPGGTDIELEFWRSVQNSGDAAEYEVYLQKFPRGAYAELARLRLARLPVARMPDVTVFDASADLKEENAKLEERLAAREAEFRRREAETEAARKLEEKARAEVATRREAELRARIEAEARAHQEQLARARQEAEVVAAQREAEAHARMDAELARREADLKAKGEAEEHARREAEERERRTRQALVERAERERWATEQAARKEAEALARTNEALARAKTEAEAWARRESEQRVRREAEIAAREEKLKKQLAAGTRTSPPLAPMLAALALVGAIAGGAYYYLGGDRDQEQAELVARMEVLAKATRELDVALQKQQELNRKVELARLAEADAHAKGDHAKLKELQEVTKRAEVEARKQAELVKRREADAEKAEATAKLADTAKNKAIRLAEKAAAVAAEKALAEKQASEKAAAAASKGAARKALATTTEEKPESEELEELGFAKWEKEALEAASKGRTQVARNLSEQPPSAKGPNTKFDGVWGGDATPSGSFDCATGSCRIAIEKGDIRGNITWRRPGWTGGSGVAGEVNEFEVAVLRVSPIAGLGGPGSFSLSLTLDGNRLVGTMLGRDCTFAVVLKKQ